MGDASALFFGSISCFWPGNLLILLSDQAFACSLSVPVCPSSSPRIINLWDYFLEFFWTTGFFDDQRRFVNEIQSPAKFSFVTEESPSFMFVHQNTNLNRKYFIIFHHPLSSWWCNDQTADSGAGAGLSRITRVCGSRQQTVNPLDYLLSKGMLEQGWFASTGELVSPPPPSNSEGLFCTFSR